MQIARSKRSIRWRLAAAFLVDACVVAAFVGVAITIHFRTLERAAQLEAGHVAELIADAAMENSVIKRSLQEYVLRLNAMRRRDVTIVDAAKTAVADTGGDGIGSTYRNDTGNEVGQTLADGRMRTFIERNEAHPDGAYQIVVALRPAASVNMAPVGAVILEYTDTREDLFAAERRQLYFIIAAGIVVVLMVTISGLGIARRITQPLRDLKASVERIAAHDYEARVADTSQDEIGLLGSAFNRMAEDLSRSHGELVEHKRELEQRVEDRTRELHQANTLIQQEGRQHQLAAERAEYLASYDSLTSLPNRATFSKLLNQALALARRNARQVAVLFVDLDRFKNINDTLGHDAGDLLLREVGKRLKGCLRDSDTVARLGGDEFVVLLPELQDDEYVEAVAVKILAATGKSFAALGQEFHVTASIGVSVFPRDGADEQSLMKNADIAMYQAKDDGRNNFRPYSERMNRHSFERLALESSLRGALERDEFQLHYQPKVDARGGAIVGMEALLRWRHPELGLLAPTRFIPVAEETGLIVSIGKWVLRTACRQNVAWQKQGLPSMNIAVNLSARQFGDDDLLADITAILVETGMSAKLLELEITESTLMHDVEKALRTLKAFRAMGLRLAIDDFGTGYSSLSTLSQFPIDTIKIDGSFIRDLAEHAGNRGIAKAIIAMGRTLSLTVIAEGVETAAQVDFLRGEACDEFQGFYFSMAVPPERFGEMLESQVAHAA
jgi:diguanylate cyclase (GGDEF)-like protein